jgi:UDP-2,3-diacylglucosamine hydrolase
VDEGQVHYINLGDWIDYQSYAEWDGRKLELKYYRKDQ